MIKNRGLHNLSQRKLNWYEENLLSKGIKFIRTPIPRFSIVFDNYIQSMDELSSYLRFRLQNNDINDKNNICKSKLTLPKVKKRKSNGFKRINDNELIDHSLERYIELTSSLIHNSLTNTKRFIHKLHPRINIPKSELRALNSLENDKSIIFKPADKNLGLCITDRTWYDNELLSQLRNTSVYKSYNHPLIINQVILKAKSKITNCVKKALERSILKERYFDEHNYLKNSIKFIEEAKNPQIYLLIKVHKSPISGRPIVPSFNSMTAPISKWLDFKLQPLAKKYLKTTIYDSQSLIQHLETHQYPKDCILATADITSLFTMIPTDLGCKYIEDFLKETDTPISIRDTIVEFLSLVLKNNFFQFKKILYHQIDGTAMGTAVAPIYANIFMGFLEKKLVEELLGNQSLLHYIRYVDDTLFIFKHTSMQNLQEIAHRFNSLHKNIFFNFEFNETSVNFLDVTIFKGPRFIKTGIFDTRTYQKAMNLHLYVPFTSFQPVHQKIGLVKTELIRHIRNSSSIDDYIKSKIQFFRYLQARGYPSWFLKKVNSCALYKQRQEYLSSSRKKNSTNVKPIIFKVDYNFYSSIINIKHLLHKYEDLLEHSYLECKPPIICWKNEKALLRKLISNKLLDWKLLLIN